MTIPSPLDAPPLRTVDDALQRVGALVGRALVERRLWLMWVDGDGIQSPVISPIEDVKAEPEPGFLAGLGQVLAGTLEPGHTAILTLERQGPPWLPIDRTWADALRRMAADAGIALRGIFIADDRGVRPAP